MNNSVIIGTLLGDATIQKCKHANFYSFVYTQAVYEYATWKANLINVEYTQKDCKRFDKRTNKFYYHRRIYLKIDRDKKEYYYNLFYTPKKEVSDEVLNQIDDLALCIWYLDDGNCYYNGNNCHISLAINGFNLESKERIIKWFREKHNLNFKHSNNAIRITSKRECEIFMSIVEKYIPECMEYKKLKFQINKYKQKPKKEKKKRIESTRKVKQIDKEGNLIKIWDNPKQIHIHMNINIGTLYSNLTNKSRYCSGFKFEYL